jgi:hypothetical protein
MRSQALRDALAIQAHPLRLQLGQQGPLSAQPEEHSRIERTARTGEQAPGIHHSHHDLRAHPIDGVRRESHPFAFVKPIEGFHQANVTVTDQVGDQNAVVAELERCKHHVPQVGFDDSASGTPIAPRLPGPDALAFIGDG